MRGITLFAMSLTALAGTPALGQEIETTQITDGKQLFEPEFFAAFSPVTALDMVRRIPGFSIDGGDGRRGFGENAGNVLIDGDRPSTKSDDIFTLLGRIPASEVERIELSEQAGADTEAQGKGQIVNVIRKISSKVSGTFAANMLVGTRHGITAFGNGSASLRQGETSYEVNFTSFSERLRGFGPEDFKTGAAQLVERRSYQGFGGYDQFSIGGAIKTRTGNVKINANGKFTISNGDDRRFGIYTNASDSIIGREKLFSDGPYFDTSVEIGGDIEFPISANLNSKLVGLYRSGTESSNGLIETARVGQPLSTFTTRNRNKPLEAVFRAQNDWSAFASHAIQFGAEIAYNRLDARFFAESSGNGVTTVFPPSNVLVKEIRFEPFVSDVWTLGSDWKVEAGAIMEFSRLSLSGDSNAERSFRFLKPRLVATWAVDKATTIEFRAERQVAQLDFGEFATSVDLALGNQVDAGNRDLVPEKVNNFAALIRHKFLERGSIQLEASYQQVSDTQDLVLITTRDALGNVTGRFDGAGNIGDSKRWNLELEITLPLDWLTAPIGINGLELKYVGHYHDSELIDPVTGRKRRVSYRPLWHQNWDLRHDIKDSGFVWGLSWGERASGNAYFFNQQRIENFGSVIGLFAEYNRFKYGTLRLEAIGLGGDKLFRNRFFYNDTRASDVLTQIINRERTLDPRIQISLSGKF